MIKWSSFGIRVLIAIIFGPVIILAALVGQVYFLAIVLLIVGISVVEFYGLEQKKNRNPLFIPGLVGALLLVLAGYFFDAQVLGTVWLALCLLYLLIELFRGVPEPLANAGATILGVTYSAVFFGHMVLIRELPNHLDNPMVYYGAAGRWLMMMFFIIWVCDTAAYLIGSAIGKHKLMKRVSPNKTVEGTVAGFIFAILTAWLCHIWFINGITWVDSLVIGVICGTIGQLGDLVESLFKRDAGVKDSSKLIPGHGGMLDRFDSLTFSAPVVFIYLKYFALA